MSTLAPFIGRLERLRAQLNDPAPFYRSQQSEWKALAQRVVEQSLVALQPEDVEPEQWQAAIAAVSARVGTEFIQDGEVGLLFSLASTEFFGEEIEQGTARSTFTIGNLSIRDVERWVSAGHGKALPDQAGKNLDERDAGKTDLQIAWTIMHALKLQKPGWERLLDHLREFIGFEASAAIETLYPELLKAWFDVFTVRAVESWRTYVHGLVTAV